MSISILTIYKKIWLFKCYISSTLLCINIYNFYVTLKLIKAYFKKLKNIIKRYKQIQINI